MFLIFLLLRKQLLGTVLLFALHDVQKRNHGYVVEDVLEGNIHTLETISKWPIYVLNPPNTLTMSCTVFPVAVTVSSLLRSSYIMAQA